MCLPVEYKIALVNDKVECVFEEIDSLLMDFDDVLNRIINHKI